MCSGSASLADAHIRVHDHCFPEVTNTYIALSGHGIDRGEKTPVLALLPSASTHKLACLLKKVGIVDAL